MALVPGTRLGPYEISSALGAGGMGEVYRARDTRLERSVAIKILPADFASSAQFKLRFEREAKTISQLNHPHICTLYDVGEGYLVMELLEGETLADKLSKGPLPIAQVLRYGVEIAGALEKAHKAGVVHRDLKPGNIMITKSGAKLLDFGLAKPSERGVIGTLTSLRTEKRDLTEEGTIVGTFQYMAPEQIEGGEVDARSDIFALGAVLYEMATGRKAFEGKSKASLIASILGAEPQPVSAIQPMAPAAFDRVVRTCLQKEPDERWQSAHDVAAELRWIAEEKPQASTHRTHPEWITRGVAAVFAVAAIVLGALVWSDRAALRQGPIVRSTILAPEKTSFDFMNAAAPPALSPDGRKIVFGAAEAGKPRTLWIRPLDALVPQQLAGTDGAIFPFWSPDGRFIAFFADNALKKMEVSGGAPVVLCPVVDGRGGSWSPDGKAIIFAGRYTPISCIPAAGGTPVEVTKLVESTTTHRWPEFLPDSRHFLYLASPNGNEDPANTIMAGDLEGKTQKRLVRATSDPHYLNGCIVFVRDHILTAQPFDLKRLALAGDAVPLKEQSVETASIFSRSIVTVSPSGNLVYQSGNTAQTTQLAWFDRAGKLLGVVGEPAPYLFVAIAPNQKTVLTSSIAPAQSNLWLFDLARGVRSRITFNDGTDTSPVWSPDGRRAIYTSLRNGRFRFMLRDLATGSEEPLLEGAAAGTSSVTSWSADGQRILYSSAGRTTRTDIWWMSLADRKPHPYLGTPFLESVARFSPDGKWVAYQSNESGRTEIYLGPFPPTGAKWQISSDGGAVARWRGDGKELFYTFVGRMMAVPITLGPTPQIGHAVKLFDYRSGVPSPGMYDVSPDGQRFLCSTRVGEESAPEPLILVEHFDGEVRAALEHRD